ncbi:hypothetical protein [Nocardia farcinica]|uniref:hypothetical protein n=1 Tax=Nocardia farcinica TaxID=37329 RepID=UPI001894304B|nr:hypothetical protein [Nocardia farcinica]MBF6189430.1 hypothetical protein [Nocardia farcinica]
MRYQHEHTGVIVDVGEETAAHLEPAYKPVRSTTSGAAGGGRRRATQPAAEKKSGEE